MDAGLAWSERIGDCVPQSVDNLDKALVVANRVERPAGLFRHLLVDRLARPHHVCDGSTRAELLHYPRAGEAIRRGIVRWRIGYQHDHPTFRWRLLNQTQRLDGSFERRFGNITA